MRISIVQPRVSYYIGGSEKVCMMHAELLSRLKNQVVLYTVRPVDARYSNQYKTFVRNNPTIKIIEMTIPDTYRYIYDETPELNQSRWDRETILFSILIHRKLRDELPDIVLSYYLVDSVFRNLDIPNVVYLGGHPEHEIEIYNAFLSFCDATIFNSENVKRRWQEKIDRNKVSLNYVIQKGAEKPAILNRVLPKKVNIVFAGRLILGKGVENLIWSFASIKKDFPEASLWILGDGPEKENLTKLAVVVGVENSVHFKGFVENVQDYFYSSTLCVFPSIYKEGLMTVVAEAMAVGACIVASEGCGNEELIKNNVSGILIKPDDRGLLTTTIRGLLIDDEKRKEIGRQAEIYVSNNLSWASVGEKLNTMLEEVVRKYK
ncbi:MAG: glycosyltransferase family 4 protein [Minisyncoccota bacterium]